jgi:hypothetical protein
VVVVGLSLVFLAVLGFAVDLGNLWFHRQAAQTVADAACTAAVMDMLSNAQGSSLGGFTSGTDFDCGGGGNPLPNSAPCKYANLNGFSATGLTSNTASNKVEFTFGTTLTGVSTCSTPPDPHITMCVPPASFLAKPIVNVNVVDRISTAFFGLVSSSRTIDVPAKASCGVVLSTAPIPLLVLDPTRNGTLSVNGNIDISIVGGPGRSIQVNSSSTTAVSVKGGSGSIDLSLAGPNGTGADMGVTGAMSKPGILTTGTSGTFVSPAGRISDPFALVQAPGKPNFPGAARSKDGVAVASGVNGCPDSAGCSDFLPGYYPNGIDVKNTTAIFEPGIYYLDDTFSADANSCMRPGTSKGDGSGGTVFYFNTANSLDVTSNSGKKCPSTTFQTLTGSGSYPNGVKCTATSSTPSNLTSSISGTVLLAPCTGPDATTGLCSPNCGINNSNGFGDQLGSSDPGGIQRGILFFQNRAVAANPSWQGGGVFLLSGSMYFHQCVTSGSDTGTGCSNSAYTTQMTLGGNPGSGTYVLGDIIVDQLSLSGTPNITMDLNPNAAYWVLKASLLQ